MSEHSRKSPQWSVAGKAWLIFWIVLAVATAVLLGFFPEWFVWKTQRVRGRSVTTSDSWRSVFLASIWLGGAVGWGYWFRAKRRSGALANIAKELSLEITPWPDEDDYAAMGDFAFFQTGFDPTAHNWMTGRIGDYEVGVLDYYFRRSSTGRDIPIRMSWRAYNQTVVAFWNVSELLPRFQLASRSNDWQRLGPNRTPKGCIVDLRIGQGTHEEFVKRYVVGGEREPDLMRFFSPRLLDYFAAHEGWDVESAEGHLLIYQERRVQPPTRMGEFLEQALEIADKLREQAKTMKG